MNFLYEPNYDSPNLRGVNETQRPWNLINEIKSYSNINKTLLDIGCGTAFKLVPLSSLFNKIVGIDINQKMALAANHLIKKNNIKNIKIICCDSNQLAIDNQSFDIITCMLSRWCLQEIVRILKPNGIVIIEHIGCADKKELKLLFGQDQEGWRGQFIKYQTDEYLSFFQEKFRFFFNSVSIRNGFWKTYYTEKGLLELLNFTPTIRNFDSKKDVAVLKNAYKIFKQPQGIELTQNRILINAQKLRNFKISKS